MKAILLLSVLGFSLPAFAVEPASVREARRALSEGIPQVAIVKLETALRAADFPADERATALRLLAEAQLAAQKPEAALETLRPLGAFSDTAARLLRAHAHAALGHWEEALAIYQALNSVPDIPVSSIVGEAECLQARGRTAEAVATLEKLVASGGASLPARLRLASLLVELGQPRDARKLLETLPEGDLSETKWRRYIEARILLLEKKTDEAAHQLDAMLADKAGLSPELAAAATLAMAEARLAGADPKLANSGIDAAEKLLFSFVRENPTSPQLDLVFRRLDQIFKLDPTPTERPLWDIVEDKDLPPGIRPLAYYYAMRMQMRAKDKDLGTIAKAIATFHEKYPDHELTPQVLVIEAELAIRRGRYADAVKAYDEALHLTQSAALRAELSLRVALVHLAHQREFVLAAGRLREAGASSRLRQIAAYDAAFSWLMQRDYAHFRKDVAAFAAQFSAPLLLGNLRLEEGLMLARTGAAEATSVLETFLHDFSRHPRLDEARLALAEIAFQDGRTEDAAVRAAAVKGTPETAEQSEYLAIFLEDKKRPHDPARVIELARKFISRHDKSHLLTEVRMKLGQVYFTTDDYLHAQEQFATLAREQSTSEYAEAALFLAGQCGTKLMNTQALDLARDYFEQVATRKGPLATSARLQQAIIKNTLGNFDDAAKICDSIVGTPGVEPEIRAAALVGKGDNLRALFEKEAPAEGTPKPATPGIRETYLTQAIAAYDPLLATPGVAPLWRNQAAYKKGRALRDLTRLPEALAVFYDILDKTDAAQRETFWFSKAGSDAARILQDQGNWEAAANVYKKMTRLPGPHAAAAAEQVKKLKLEHFLWD
jgi:tetratricopeptide (TPR) repeat protein